MCAKIRLSRAVSRSQMQCNQSAETLFHFPIETYAKAEGGDESAQEALKPLQVLALPRLRTAPAAVSGDAQLPEPSALRACN